MNLTPACNSAETNLQQTPFCSQWLRFWRMAYIVLGTARLANYEAALKIQALCWKLGYKVVCNRGAGTGEGTAWELMWGGHGNHVPFRNPKSKTPHFPLQLCLFTWTPATDTVSSAVTRHMSPNPCGTCQIGQAKHKASGAMGWGPTLKRVISDA